MYEDATPCLGVVEHDGVEGALAELAEARHVGGLHQGGDAAPALLHCQGAGPSRNSPAT